MEWLVWVLCVWYSLVVAKYQANEMALQSSHLTDSAHWQSHLTLPMSSRQCCRVAGSRQCPFEDPFNDGRFDIVLNKQTASVTSAALSWRGFRRCSHVPLVRLTPRIKTIRFRYP